MLIPGGPLGGGVAVPAQPQNPQDLQLRVEQQQKQIEELQRKLQAETEERVHERMRGQTGKDRTAPAPNAVKEDEKVDKPDNADKPVEKPQTRPE